MDHHLFGTPSQEGSDFYMSCLRCNKPLRSSLGVCNWPIPIDEANNCVAMEDEQAPPMTSLRHNHVGSERTLGSGQRHGSKHDFGVIMKHIHELEGQVRLVRNKNIEFKRALTCLFSLAQATHLEVKHHNIKIVEKVEHLEETLGLLYPHKARKNAISDNVSSKLEALGRNLDKLKEEMIHAGLHTVNNIGKARNAYTDGVVLNI